MSASVLVRKPGLLTTVQDLGRRGLGRFGVSVSGAMDPLALRLANRLVGNPEGAPALEITAIGPELELRAGLLFAIAGANLSAALDGESLQPWRSYRGRPGQVLAFGARRQGARCYLAFAGSVVVPPVMGAAATDLEAGLGGLDGAPLRAGQALELGRVARASPPLEVSPRVLAAYQEPFELRFIPEQALPPSEAAVAELTSSAYRIGSRSNRMGYRLEGRPIPAYPLDEQISEPVPPGTIQVPGGGEPILLMADRPTVGGYPRIGYVIAADLPKAGQLWLGHQVRFRATTCDHARALLAAQEALLVAALHA